MKNNRPCIYCHPFHIACGVHGQGLTDQGHNQYTSILFIQHIEHPSDGIRFGENYKTTIPSSILSMLLSEELQTMSTLPSIPHNSWVHGQGTTSLKHNRYTGVLSIQAHRAPKQWDQIWRGLQNNHVILSLVYILSRRTTCHGCITTHSAYLIGAWVRSDKIGT